MIAALPDDSPVYVPGVGETTLGAIRGEVKRYLTTGECSRRYGWSRSYWADVAATLDGAIRGREWHLPVEGVEAHVAAKTRSRRAATPPSSAPVRSSGLQRRER
jgi:hypothetical protein